MAENISDLEKVYKLTVYRLMTGREESVDFMRSHCGARGG